MAFCILPDPRIIFARLARMIRLARALVLRIEKEIATLKAGRRLARGALISQATRAEHGDEDLEDKEPPEILYEYEAPERFDFLDAFDGPGEDKEFRALAKGPLKDAIAAICAGLGLKPDWSLWTDQGFPPPPGGRPEDWAKFFTAGLVLSPPQQNGANLAGEGPSPTATPEPDPEQPPTSRPPGGAPGRLCGASP